MTNPTSQTKFTGAMNRRQLLGLGGSSLLGAALLAACSHDTPAATHVGVPPTTEKVEEVEVTDEVLLRTAASLEYNAIDTYQTVLDLGLLTGDFVALRAVAKRFQAEHQEHADAINALVVAAGGKAYTQANERINRLYIAPTLLRITGDDNIEASPTPAEDAVALAIGLENLAAATYQSVTSVLESLDLRTAAITIGQTEARHATLLVRAAAPALTSIVPTTDPTTGAENLSALPNAFGQLSSITVSAGMPSDSGIKPSINFDTPSLNSLISSK